MLSVQSRKSLGKATPNLLPCRIHHDGSVGSTSTYWNPSTNIGEMSAQVQSWHLPHLQTSSQKAKGYRTFVAASSTGRL